MAAAGGGGSGGAAGGAGAAAAVNPAAGYDAIVAIDFGTHGTGYAVAFPSKEAFEDPMRAVSDVMVFKPGEGSGRSDKQLTALLLNPRDNTLLQFGSRARKQFAELCDDPRAEPALYFHTFKMALAAGPTRPRDVMRITLPAVGKVAAGGTAGTTAGFHPTCELMTLVQRVLEFVKSDAFEFLKSRIPRAPHTLKIYWVLTVPAIWDDEGKAFMREAAYRAKLIDSPDSMALQLALEPESAVLASIADMPPATREAFKPGTRIMVVDCGGGTVDITIDEIVSMAPLSLREVAPASGGSWGATYVDKQFMGFIKEVLGDKWGCVDHRAQLELLNAWEAEKREVGSRAPTEDTADVITIPMNDVMDNIADKVASFSKEDMSTLVDNFNTKHGLFGPDAVTLTRAKRLQVPGKLTRSFFMSVINKTLEHIAGLLESGRAGRIDYMVLVGGFAESKLLQTAMRTKFEVTAGPTPCRVISPLRPGQVVTIGAALFALQPRAIASRVMRWTYAYLGAEPFNAAVHDEKHAFVTAENRKLVNILYPLVVKDKEVEVSWAVEKRGLIPVRSDQVVIDFDIYRTTEPVTDPRAEPSKPRTVPVDSLADGGRNNGVLKKDKVATLSVTIGASDKPRTERTVNLHMSFASTEIVAHAESTHSGDKKKVTIRYE